jgi:hypothetical protein
MKENKKSLIRRHPVLIALFCFFGLFFLIFMITFFSALISVLSESSSSGVKNQINSKSLPIEDQIKQDIKQTLGESNRDVEKVRKISVTEYKGEYAIIVDFNADDNLKADWIIGGIDIDAKNVFEKIYKKYFDVKQIKMNAYYPITDSYGQVENKIVATIGMNRDTANKINWDNKDFVNLETVADIYFIP